MHIFKVGDKVRINPNYPKDASNAVFVHRIPQTDCGEIVHLTPEKETCRVSFQPSSESWEYELHPHCGIPQLLPLRKKNKER